ncbi:MAG TPA: MiaB/RimO family radical SAM methylthiotransferase [Vicinamibacterales bacterium]|nr:MiaB/RimO family radical SAM methylthiotransferase [Vicinamibacterales bacterium]
MKFSIVTFGCRVNQSDSLGFEEQFLAAGGQSVAADAADVVVVNTCSVTASADQGARQTIRRIARTNPRARIVVTGCYATRERDEVAQLPNVECVVANDHKPQLLRLVRVAGEADADRAGAFATTAERYGDGDGHCGAVIEPGVAGRTAFTLRVQTGCAEACSYCIIPVTRGAPRSASLQHLVSEVARVKAAGFKEVVLTGVHLGSYGRDLESPGNLLSLLTALRDRFEDPGPGGAPPLLFRISSLEPMDCTPEIVALVRDSACFAPHFHLPLQHGSARVLRAMRRPYDLAYYAALVDSIRGGIPNASIGSDLIVGFPGESDDDFEQLASYLEHSPLTHLHVFPYSDRPGTAASSMANRSAGLVVKARGARLRQIGSTLTRRFVESQVGTVHRALTLEDGALVVTGNYLKVRVPPGRSRNEWVEVRITRCEPDLRGELVSAGA